MICYAFYFFAMQIKFHRVIITCPRYPPRACKETPPSSCPSSAWAPPALLSVVAHAQDKFIHHSGVYWYIKCVKIGGTYFLCILSATEVLALNMAVVDLIGRRLCNWLSFRFMDYILLNVSVWEFRVRKYGNAVLLWYMVWECHDIWAFLYS